MTMIGLDTDPHTWQSLVMGGSESYPGHNSMDPAQVPSAQSVAAVTPKRLTDGEPGGSATKAAPRSVAHNPTFYLCVFFGIGALLFFYGIGVL